MRRITALVAWAVVAFAPQTVLAQGLPRTEPAALGLSVERLERIGEVMQGYVDEGKLAGAVVLVAKEGRVVYLEGVGYRDREAGAPMEVDAIFRIASQTKALVSVAVMMLQEEGKLRIDDAVGVYLPEFMETTVAVRDGDDAYRVVPARRPITIHDLLTHTAGVGYGGGVAADRWEEAEIQGWYFAHRDEPMRATVRRMAALPFDAQPGERFVYGYSTDILGALVEHVTGLPLDEALRTRLFEPLGMVDTHFYLPPEKADRLSVVYSLGDDGLVRAPDPGRMVGQGAYVDGPRRSFSGGAGLLSTASDYGRFLQMLLNGGALDGVRILRPATVALMTSNQIGDIPVGAGSKFGLGFRVVRDVDVFGAPSSVGEFGWGGAYHSTYWVDPAEEMVVVYLSQLIPARGVDDHARVRELVYEAIRH